MYISIYFQDQATETIFKMASPSVNKSIVTIGTVT